MPQPFLAVLLGAVASALSVDAALDLHRALTPHDIAQPPAQPEDWRAQADETRLPLASFLKTFPPLPANQRMYVLAIGRFAPEQAQVLADTEAYLRLAYAMPVLRLPDLPDEAVSPRWRIGDQWHAPTVLLRVVEPLRPPDAAAVLAFTVADLTPGGGWNFVYGQAMPQYKVGIWSLARLGDADAHVTLRRVLVTAAHETGHMLGIDHCAGPRCLMNGANHQQELDGTPLLPCADDAVRFLWRSPVEPVGQARALAAFLHQRGLNDDGDLWAARAADLAFHGPVDLPARPSASSAKLTHPRLSPALPRTAPSALPEWVAWLVLGLFPLAGLAFVAWAVRRQRPRL